MIFSKYYKVIKSIDYVIFLITKYRLEYFVILPWSNLEYFVILPWSNLEYFGILSQGSREYSRTEFRLMIHGPEANFPPRPAQSPTNTIMIK